MTKKAAKKLVRGKRPAPRAPDENFDELIGGKPEVKAEVVREAERPVEKVKHNHVAGQLRAGHPETSIPVCPIVPDNTMGDKDPSVVAWWRENHPELAEKKYAGRKVNG